jgi:hypothetical protein
MNARLGSIELTLRRILYALLFTALLISAVQLQLGGEQLYARILFAVSLVVMVGMLLARTRKNR